MRTTPKSLRLQIGIFGRTNVGKSSFLNFVAGQDVAITSPVPGTTTDVVEKSMELLPVGPVVFLDTAGIDDVSTLANLRIKKTVKIFDRADVIALIVEPGMWGEYEEHIVSEAQKRSIPYAVIINKVDVVPPTAEYLALIKTKATHSMQWSSVARDRRDEYVHAFKKILLDLRAHEILQQPALLGDLVPADAIVVLVVPIDLEAPKGRIILPQVQAIRDALDHQVVAVVAKESEYPRALAGLREPPALVACDSQAVRQVFNDTPPGVKCTTFSILFSRHRGDLLETVRGALAIDRLQDGDAILIAEACSHHAIEGDIGRIKIPRWLRQYTGADIRVDVCSGRDYPENLNQYKLIIHCGGCMITRREMLTRLTQAKAAGVSITNYGIAIALLHGLLERALSPFPEALDLFMQLRAMTPAKKGMVYADTARTH